VLKASQTFAFQLGESNSACIGTRILAFLSKMGQNRSPVTRDTLQLAITDAVRKSDPACEPFVGVVIERTAQSTPASNWAIRGIKFGKADQERSSRALKSVVESMQREFLLSEDTSTPERDAENSLCQKPRGR
jgi:hypothetical protein